MSTEIDLPPNQLPGTPKCPTCGEDADGYTPADLSEVRMREGDYTICAYCSSVNVRTETGFRKATGKDMAKLSIEELADIKKALALVRMMTGKGRE